MPIELTCEGCQRRLRVPDDRAGMQVRCPNCRTVFSVPYPEAVEAEIVGQPDYQAAGEPWQPNADGFEAGPGVSDNPYAAPPQFRTSPQTRRKKPHRGGLILTLAILGWVVCVFLSVAAWAMGSGDLKEMKAGRMDRSGYDLTRAGMIVGMVQVILAGVILVIYLFFFIVMVAVN